MRSPPKTGPCSPSIFLPLMLLAALGLGCSQQRQPSSGEQVDKRLLAEDSRAMARRYEQWQQELRAQAGKGGANAQMPLNLTDEAQYRFVKNRLRAAGNTPESSPHLFHRLEMLHKDKKAGDPGLTSRKDLLTTTSAEGTPEKSWCGHLLPLTDVESPDTTVAKFEASGLVTCFNGSDYAYVDVTAYVTDAAHTQFRVLGTQALEEYAGVVLETPLLDLDLKPNPGEQLFVDSVAVAFNEVTGESHVSYAVAESSLVAAELPDINIINVQHPRELIGRHLTDNPIRTCLERGGISGYLDCDDASGSKDPVTGVFKPFSQPFTGVAAADAEQIRPPYSPWSANRAGYWETANGVYDITRLYVPMRGNYQVRLPSNCTVNAITSDATLILLEAGGRCTAGTAPGTSVLNGSIPFKTPYLDEYEPTRLVVPYDGLADFGPDCLSHFQNVRLMLRATLRATCIDEMSAITRPYVRSRFQSIQTLDFHNLCMAEGTQVVKADGQAVAVQDVKVGDKLLANGKGLALTVMTVSRGAESKPLVKLRDERGGEVMVTETHPMVTAARGAVQARELKVGEALLTRTGPAKLVSVERVPYDGQVFNFALGTPEELASLGPEARTLYANGFLVGDSHMQTRLERQRTLEASEVLARLPRAWYEDYRLYLARHTRR